jgi:hypothetical protein
MFDDDDDELPDFAPRKLHMVMPYITKVLASPSGSALLKLIPYEDGHYRAIFKSTYFALQPDATEPTKSQWSTLKKKMKRHDGRTFIFKAHGEIDCAAAAGNVGANRDYVCLYVDFGFFA